MFCDGRAPDGGLSQGRGVSCRKKACQAFDGSYGSEGGISSQKSQQGRLDQVQDAVFAAWDEDNKA